MDIQLTSFTLLALSFTLIGQWWWMRKRWMLRLHAVQASHARYKARAEVLLELTKQRTMSLQQQMTGRPKADSADLVRLMTPCHDGAEVIVMEEDSLNAHFPNSSLASFA